MLKKFTLIFAALVLFGSAAAYAQMSDDAIISYITQGVAAGKTQSQIGNELLAKGVTVSQAKRLMQSYKSMQASGEGISGAVRLENSRSIRETSRTRNSSVSEDIDGRTGTDGTAKDAEGRTTDLSKSGEEGKDIEYEVDENGVRVPVAKKKIYGHDLFSSKTLTFEPNENSATPGSYVIGPGDEIIIDVWGANETSIKQTVSPEGQIIIAQVGPVALSGLTIDAATEKIRTALSKKYSLSGSNPASHLSVTLGKIRTIQVNVLGEVKVPGTYRLSSLTSVFNALYRAGGVSEIGSLRNIMVSRNGEVIATVDIYKFLFEGKRDGDVSLTDGDAIIVPPYEALVEAKGGVKRPMYYEIIDGEPLEKVLSYAGGFVSNAHPEEMTVQRMDGSNGSVYTVKQDEYASFGMKGGDVLTAYTNSRKDVFANRIEIKGGVVRPGVYELGGNIATVRQLVEHAGGLLDDAFLERAQIIREKEDRTLEVQAVAIGAIMSGNSTDITLKKNDIVIISMVSDVEKKGDLTITGYVLNPGNYEFADGMTVEDLILLAGGLDEGASAARIDVSRRIVDKERTTPSDTLAKVFTFSIADNLAVDGDPNFTLEPYDVVSVRKSPVYTEQRKVRISGEVAFPGEYTLVSNTERLSDLFARAGGPTPNAYISGSTLKRKVSEDERNVRRNVSNLVKKGGDKKDSTFVEKLKINEIYSVGINLDKALSRPGTYNDVVLHDGDELIIPSQTNTVRIQGEVMYPNAVNFIDGKRVRYYVTQAGGFSNEAKRGKVYVVYMNGKVGVGQYAKVTPGCEIIVPSRPERQRMTVGEWIGIGSSAASITTMIATVVSLFGKK